MLIRIIFIGLSLCIINLFLKKQSPEFVLPVEIIFITLSAALATEYFKSNLSWLKDITEQIQHGEEIYISASKGAGICLITKLSSDVCSESGNKLISDVIEFTGRLMLLTVAAPYIKAILSIAIEFIK